MDTDGFVAGGYFLTRPVVRDDVYTATDLLPPRFVTLSGCLAAFAFDFWWNEENVAAASGFGVSARRFGELIAWYRERFGRDLGAPNVAYSTAVIREFVRGFVDDPDGLTLVGCAVSADDRTRLRDRHRSPGGGGTPGVIEMLDRDEPLDPGGVPLGFEPVSFEYGLECSWLCNSLERPAAAALGIRPDPATGLVATYDDAVRVVGYIGRDDVGAEPGTWCPWLLVRYPFVP